MEEGTEEMDTDNVLVKLREGSMEWQQM